MEGFHDLWVARVGFQGDFRNARSFDDMVFSHHPGSVAGIAEELGQRGVGRFDVGFKSHHGLLMRPNRHGPTRELSREDIVAAGRANGRSHMLSGHQHTFVDQSIKVRGQVAPFSLGERIEHGPLHIIDDDENKIRPVCSCSARVLFGGGVKRARLPSVLCMGLGRVENSGSAEDA